MSKIGTRINVDALFGRFPQKAHEHDAAYDLYVRKNVEVCPNSRFLIPLSFRIQLPSNMKLLIQPRSGQSSRGMQLRVHFPQWLGGDYLGHVRENLDVILGLIDCDYGKEVHAIVNSGRWKLKHRIMRLIGFKFYVGIGSRICQGAFTYVPAVELVSGPVNGTRDGIGSTDD